MTMADRIIPGTVIVLALLVTLAGCASLPIGSPNGPAMTDSNHTVHTPMDTPSAIAGGGAGAAGFQITNLDGPSKVARGDTVSVAATIENRGDASDRNVTLHLKGEDTATRIGAVDIVFVVDDSQSMADKIDTIRDELETFQQELDSRGADAHYAVVTVTGDAVIEQHFTASVSETQTTLDDIGTGGGEEFNYRALEMAIDLDGRTDARRVVIDLTDEPTDRQTDRDPTQDELVQKFDESDTTFIAVSPDGAFIRNVTEHGSGSNFEGGNHPSLDKRILAEKTQTGTWFDLLEGDFGEKFTDDIATEVTTISQTERKTVRLDGWTTTTVSFQVETANLPSGEYTLTVSTGNASSSMGVVITESGG